MPQYTCSLIRITLRHLGLLDQDNRITSACEHLVHASDEHYRALLQTQLKVAYSDLFERLDILPFVDHKLLKETFTQCGYEPVSMQQKMITLLKGLSTEAGMRLAGRKDENERAIDDAPLLSENAPVPRAEEEPAEETRSLSSPAAIGRAANTEAREADVILTCLYRLPSCDDWTDADETWWLQAIASATAITAEKILHAAKRRRFRNEQALPYSNARLPCPDTLIDESEIAM